MNKIAIVGGGIAGLALASNLDPSKFSITIFDKGKGKGGRVSTRRKDDFHFDHGAQYISDTDSPFRLTLDEWLEQGIIKPWSGKLGELKGSHFINTYVNKEVYVGVPSMSTIGTYLASKVENTTFEQPVEVANIFKKFNEWYLEDTEDNIHGGYDFLVIAIPPPQAKSLVEEFEYLVTILNDVTISPRWALMLGLSYRLKVDFDGVFINNSKIRWLARNNSKPERPEQESWIIHADKAWSAKYIERDDNWIIEELYEEFLNIAGFESYDTELKLVHRWRYAIVDQPLKQNFICDNNRNIALTGDYCMGDNIEAAYLSGENLAKRLNKLRI